jgi:hypothetical protein
MRKAFIPESWITPKLGADALRTLIAIALHADKHGVSYIKNEVLVEMLGKETRQIQIDFGKAERLGLISRKYSDKGKRYFQIHMDPCPDESGVQGAQHECAMGRNSNAQGGAMEVRTMAQSECAPPNNPHIGTLYSSTVSIQQKERGGDAVSDTECLSVSNASLPQTELKQEAPPDVIRMATQLQLESWIGQVKFQNILLSDWRVKETLAICHSQGGRKGCRYAWGVFKKLPDEKPKPETNGYSSAAVSHIPNLQPKPRQADPYELVFREISNRIADAKWSISAKSRCLDKLFTLERAGSAESYRFKLEKVIEEVKDDVQ